MISYEVRARHSCADCTKKIEMDAQKATGLTIEMIDALEQNAVE